MNLKNLNVQEMNRQEMSKTEGGFWWAIAGALALSAIENWGDIREGWHDGGTGNPRY